MDRRPLNIKASDRHPKLLLSSGHHPPGRSVLTSQLYFPDEPANAGDWQFRRELLVTAIESADTIKAQFDFVVALD
jgi:protocatechuate 3,4-dioxygenase beta subunit